MNIFLMCQGQQRRLPTLSHPKHLLQVNGESILRRTIRLAEKHSKPSPMPLESVSNATYVFTVVGHQQHRDALEPDWRGFTSLAEPGICIVDGILQIVKPGPFSHCFDGHRTLILLGDVVWSEAALAKVLHDTRPVVFAGTPVLSPSQGEVFALAFDNPQEVYKLCMTCPCRMDGSRLRGFRQQQGGHLRSLLWHLQTMRGMRVPQGLRQSWHPDVYLPIDDWTNDIDDAEDLCRLPEIERLAALEVDPTPGPVAG